jgi:hypothetical protein
MSSLAGRGTRQEPAVEFGNVFRCQANVKRGSVLRYRDGIDFARKAIVESPKLRLEFIRVYACQRPAPSTDVAGPWQVHKLQNWNASDFAIQL